MLSLYLPFPRAIEADAGVHHGTYHSKGETGGFLSSSSLLWFCLLLVALCATLYIVRSVVSRPDFQTPPRHHRLRKLVKPSTLRKVPSLSYWIPPQEDEEQVPEYTDIIKTHFLWLRVWSVRSSRTICSPTPRCMWADPVGPTVTPRCTWADPVSPAVTPRCTLADPVGPTVTPRCTKSDPDSPTVPPR